MEPAHKTYAPILPAIACTVAVVFVILLIVYAAKRRNQNYAVHVEAGIAPGSHIKDASRATVRSTAQSCTEEEAPFIPDSPHILESEATIRRTRQSIDSSGNHPDQSESNLDGASVARGGTEDQPHPTPSSNHIQQFVEAASNSPLDAPGEPTYADASTTAASGIYDNPEEVSIDLDGG